MTATDQPAINATRRSRHEEQSGSSGSSKQLARTAGLLYLTVAILGGFAHLVARGTVYVPGDAAATTANVQVHADLVRIGVVADLAQATIFVFLGMTLFRLLKHVNREVAGAMLILMAIATTIICLNMVFQYAGLAVATETSYATDLGPEGANTLVLLLFDIQRYGYLIAQIFFGLWLIPLGYLTHRSGFFPNTLSVLLIIGGICYLAGTIIELLAPDIGVAIETFIYIPPAIAELWTIAYLMKNGFTRQPTPRAPELSPGASYDRQRTHSR